MDTFEIYQTKLNSFVSISKGLYGLLPLELTK